MRTQHKCNLSNIFQMFFEIIRVGSIGDDCQNAQNHNTLYRQLMIKRILRQLLLMLKQLLLMLRQLLILRQVVTRLTRFFQILLGNIKW